MQGAKCAVWRATQAIRDAASSPRPASQMFKSFWNEPLGSAVFLGEQADAPHQAAPGLEFVFFSMRRTVSRLTLPRPVSWRAASLSWRIVQRSRPCAGPSEPAQSPVPRHPCRTAWVCQSALRRTPPDLDRPASTPAADSAVDLSSPLNTPHARCVSCPRPLSPLWRQRCAPDRAALRRAGSVAQPGRGRPGLIERLSASQPAASARLASNMWRRLFRRVRLPNLVLKVQLSFRQAIRSSEFDGVQIASARPRIPVVPHSTFQTPRSWLRAPRMWLHMNIDGTP